MDFSSQNFSKFLNVLVSILKYVFLVLGVFVAFISGYIEFEVFKGFLPKTSIGGLNYLAPLLLVCSLEVSKIYMTYSNKRFGMLNDINYGSDKKYFNAFRKSLIGISVGCTILFTTYNLSSPNEDNAIAAVEVKVHASFDRQVDQITSDIEAQVKTQIGIFNSTIKTQDSIMKAERDNTFANSKEFIGPRYKEAERLKNEAIEERAKIIAALNTRKTAAIIEINKQRDVELDRAIADVFGSSEASNPMIAIVLQIFNQSREYPLTHYIVMVLLISLVISFAIEGVIWASLTMVAILYGKSLEFIQKHNEIKEQNKILNDTLNDVINGTS